MTKIAISEVSEFLRKLKITNNNVGNNITSLERAIHQYNEDGRLEGEAIARSKAYYNNIYFPLCQAIREGMRISESLLEQYLNDFAYQVDSSADCCIDADGLFELSQRVDRLERDFEELQQSLSIGTGTLYQGKVLKLQMEMFNAWKKEQLLEKYIQFEQSHGNFFSGLEELTYHIKRAVQEIDQNISFDSSTGLYDFGNMNASILTDLQKTMRRTQPERDKKALEEIAVMDENGTIIGVNWERVAQLLREPNKLTSERLRALQILWNSRFDVIDEYERGFFAFFAPIISPLLGFEYNQDNDYYFTNEHSLQRYGGFMDFYDDAGFLLGMDLDTEVITFISGDKEYRVQLWKGNYGLGAAYGGELGIYYRNASDANANPYQEGTENSKLIWYRCVDEQDELVSTSTIYDKTTGEQLIRNSTRDYAENGDHFWNLAIQTNFGQTKENLYMVERIEIPNEELRNDFVEALKKETDISNIIINGDAVTFTWKN
ncbi:DUF4474 domain-containing protein [Listeria monocytogenes]|uniref:T7SS effector LXG polymorphic toxin n=1 Tax=Listeria monocytogenes TaxID=1639 RepID=UPI0010E33832|nr:DUF4474 domain-containing protein [Listeria monocytogenes]EAC8433357.1 DUF4474 domain-containing protein [Listeria monocytogenes]EAG9289808.1 DUF4474 domain-containing protein [Listeria monocytogenes]